MIQTNNYCEQKISIKDGLPVTTKHDKNNHGFGLKSIKYTAEKYHGTLNVELNKNWIELKVIIPHSSDEYAETKK